MCTQVSDILVNHTVVLYHCINLLIDVWKFDLEMVVQLIIIFIHTVKQYTSSMVIFQ